MKQLFALLLLFATLLCGCETIPVQQMSDARQALRAAEQAGAEHYSAELYSEARMLMEDADRFLAEGRYSLAGKLAERARKLAIRARQQAADNRVQKKGTLIMPEESTR